MAVETSCIFSTRFTLSSNAPRATLEARCNLSLVRARAPCGTAGSDDLSVVVVAVWGAAAGPASATASGDVDASLGTTGSAGVASVKAGCSISKAAGDSAADDSVWAAAVSGLPHSRQNIPGSRTAAPHDEQRVEISGCCILNFVFRNLDFEISKSDSSHLKSL